MSDAHPYTADQRQRMLAIARTTLQQMLLTGEASVPQIHPDETYLAQKRGCFVTLHHRHGRLRGCIGNLDPTHALAEAIARMTAAATRDPRFVFADPVVLAECNDLRIEISILTPMQPITDPRTMRLGVDGIHIRSQSNGQTASGCFLPQVALEQNWDVEQTLSACCHGKMGLKPDAWKDPQNALQFSIFQSIIVGES